MRTLCLKNKSTNKENVIREHLKKEIEAIFNPNNKKERIKYEKL